MIVTTFNCTARNMYTRSQADRSFFINKVCCENILSELLNAKDRHWHLRTGTLDTLHLYIKLLQYVTLHLRFAAAVRKQEATPDADAANLTFNDG